MVIINPNPARRLGSPFVRVRVGKDVFVSGDGLLQRCSVTLAEGKAQSSCEFAIYDRGRVFAQKYFETIYARGGLDPVIAPEKKGKGNRSSGKSFSGDTPPSDSLNGADSSRVQEAIDYYLGQGLSPAGTAAMIGNMIQESTLNPLAVGTDQGAEGTPGASEGLIQWTFERKEGLPDDFEGQLGFALEEMERHGDTRLLSDIKDPDVSLDELKDGFYGWIAWGDEGSRWAYAEKILEAIEGSGKTQSKESTKQAQSPQKETKQTPVKVKTGQQITVELGYDGQVVAAYSFLHTRLEYDLFSPDLLTFGGQAASWVMGQHKRNTAYQNATFKQVAERIAGSYGLELDMKEAGPNYEYFAQRNQTDFEAIAVEAARIGFKVYTDGKKLKIGPREAKEATFTLEYGKNMGTTFRVVHTAQTDSGGGARSSDPSDRNSTGEKKFFVNPGSGELVQENKEVDTGSEKSDVSANGTTGGHLSLLKPLTDGKTDKEDKTRKANEKRIKGIIATWQCPTYPELLTLTPDDSFLTKGITAFLDRIWVIESITHDFSQSGFVSSGSIYTPMKNKFPDASISKSDKKKTDKDNADLPAGCRGKLAQAALDYEGSDTSAGPDGGNNACVYAINRIFENAGLTNPWGSSEYVPDAESALQSSAELVEAGDEQAGDIIIADDGVSRGHIGIILGPGESISNSSSAAKFVWRSDASFEGYYGAGNIRIYRLNC